MKQTLEIAVCIAIILQLVTTTFSKQPNILFILTDDQGYYDVGYQGSEILTPHIDELAASGVKLENYYVQQMCTPSRSVLLTGRYQIHTGMQNGVLGPGIKFGVPSELPLLSEQLQDLGYATHMVGKWHLGYHQKEYTPTYRGFESFFGCYNHAIDYWSKEIWGDYDLHYNVRDEMTVAWNNTEYATSAFARRAVDVISDHDQEKPLFLYLAFNAPHTPLQAPQEYLDKYNWITDDNRQISNAMITAIDDGIQSVTDALKEANMFDNTIIIYTSDNGGTLLFGGSNWPLRGMKGTYYEGGMRSSAFVSSPLLPKGGIFNNGLMHISDWYPTLVNLAGGDTGDLEIDGYDIWDSIANGTPSPREELLLNIDPLATQFGGNLYPEIFDVRTTAGIRVGNWKLLTGHHANNAVGERPPLAPENNEVEEDEGKVRLRRQLERNIMLFNLEEDPREDNDVSDDNQEIVIQLLERLAFHNSTAWEAVNYADLADPDYDPANTGGAHYPWL